jgi:transposase
MSKRRKFTAEFKGKVALEALRESSTLSEIANKYDLHQNQVSTWKKDAMASLSHLFADKRVKDDRLKEVEVQVDDLHRKVGQLKMERDWLKKSLWTWDYES